MQASSIQSKPSLAATHVRSTPHTWKSLQQTPPQQTPLQHWSSDSHWKSVMRQHLLARQSWKSQQSQVSVQKSPVRWQQVGLDPGFAAWHVEVA